MAPSAMFSVLAPVTVWLYAACALLLSLYGLHRYLCIARWWRYRSRGTGPPPPPAVWPSVTVQLPIFNERYVVERLVDAVCAFDYPRDRLQVQLLDDSTDDTTRIAAAAARRYRAAGLDVVHLHRTEPHGFKAGALADGLLQATGEFIAIFDADFVPPRDFLRRTVPYFADAGIGMVQVRWGHLNRRFSLLTRIQALFLDGHFLLEHTARHGAGHFFNFNGTAGIWRRQTIDDAGGWEHDTLTEDLDLSYRAQLAGWRFAYAPEIVAPAELPVDMNGFKSQQHRWAKGSVQTARKLLGRVWRSGLPLGTKLEATVHLTANLCYVWLLGLAVLAYPAVWVRHVYGWGPGWMALDAAVIGMAVVSVGAFYAVAAHAGQRAWWRGLALLPALMALGVGLAVNNAAAAAEALLAHDTPFRRTPKYGVTRRGDTWQTKRYRAPLRPGAILEAGLAVYLALAAGFTWQAGLWYSLPFMTLLAAGFAYVAAASLGQWAAGRRARRPAPLTARSA